MYRILHFELDDDIGGIETFLYNVYKNIDRTNFQFEFVTTKDNPGLGKELEKLGGVIHKVSPYFQLNKYIADIEQIIKDRSYDVIHIHKNSASNIIPFYLAHKYNYQNIIAHAHNTSASEQKIYNLLHYINRSKLNQWTTKRFACSQLAADWLYGSGYKAEIIKNGISTEEFDYNPEVRYRIQEELGLTGHFVVGHVGRFSEQKNHSFILKVFGELLSQKENARLVLVGDGENMGRIRKEAEKLNLTDKIEFTGARSDVSAILQAFDVFLLPSFFEGLPIAGIEAQAAGLPVIASDSISDELNVTSLVDKLSLKESPIQWANRILELYQKFPRESHRKEIAEKGFDIKVTTKRLEMVYSKTENRG